MLEAQTITKTVEIEQEAPSVLEAAIAETKHPPVKPIPEGYRELPAGKTRWIKINKQSIGEPMKYLGKYREPPIEVYEDITEEAEFYLQVIIDGESTFEMLTEVKEFESCCTSFKADALKGVMLKTSARLLVKG